jgi:hypothetical protein
MGALQFSHEVRDAVDSWKGIIISYILKLKNFQGFFFQVVNLMSPLLRRLKKAGRIKRATK